MIDHILAIGQQVQTDCYSFFEPRNSSLESDFDRRERNFYQLGRLSCAAVMAGSAIKVLTSSDSLNTMFNIGTLILSHDIFHILKNQQTLKNEFQGNHIVAVGKGIISGGKTFIKSVWEGRSDHEIASKTFRATFNELAELKSQNTLLKPLWNELQLQYFCSNYR